MSKLFTGLLVALAVALAGCGGGGGSSTPTNTGGGGTTKDPTDRTITGKVINSATGAAVPNVLISLGYYTDETGTDGTFSLGPIPLSDEIPSTFVVDASGAGEGFNRDYLVTYNTQEYLYNAIDTPVDVRNGGKDDLGTITVKYSPDGTPSIPYPVKDTVIAGRIVRSDTTNVGIAGVTVTFGTAVITRATSGKNGYFALNVGRDVNVLSLFMASQKKFSISVPTGSVPGLVTPVQVSYGGVTSAANNITVPDDILSNISTDLGNILVVVGGTNSGGGGNSGGGDLPPFPF